MPAEYCVYGHSLHMHCNSVALYFWVIFFKPLDSFFLLEGLNVFAKICIRTRVGSSYIGMTSPFVSRECAYGGIAMSDALIGYYSS